jgi:hypothetical protein
MGFHVICAVAGHKWTPAEETNEAGLRLECKRCGRVKNVSGTDYERAEDLTAREFPWGGATKR